MGAGLGCGRVNLRAEWDASEVKYNRTCGGMRRLEWVGMSKLQSGGGGGG
jgi:hypothetical protein